MFFMCLKSAIITSQLPVKEWYDVIGEKTVADAILDRLSMMLIGSILKVTPCEKIEESKTCSQISENDISLIQLISRKKFFVPG